MTEYAQTLEEELAKQKVTGSYIWKPNRLFVKRGNHYESADVVSDNSMIEVLDVIDTEGILQIGEVETAAETQKALIASNERDYNSVRASLLQTYRRLRDYFLAHEMDELAASIISAIEKLEGELTDG